MQGGEEKKKFDLRTQRRLAAEILKCGLDRVWFNPEHLKEISEAITREEIRILIHKGYIRKKEEEGTSRARARVLHIKRRKGRRRGHGKRKGKASARRDKKEDWINRIRKIRRFLRYLKERGIIDRRTYRKLRQLAKGGHFRSLSHLKIYMKKELGIEVK